MEANKEEIPMKTADSNMFELYIFYCSNSSRSDEFDFLLREDKETVYHIISLPCSGKANALYFLKAFETGADGLVIITCSEKKCRYLEGNLRAPKRAETIDLLLEETGMGRGRIAVLRRNGNGGGSENESDDLISRIEEFRDQIRMMSSRDSSLEQQSASSPFRSLPSGTLRL